MPKFTILALAALALLALPIAAHAEPNPHGFGGGGAYGGGTHSPRVGPSGYHDPNVPAKVTHDAITAAAAAAVAKALAGQH